MNNYINKKDIKIILGIILFSFILMAIFSLNDLLANNVYAEISYNGNVIKTVPLNQNEVITINERPSVILEIKDNAVAFIASDCPDKVCVNTGYIKSGFAACLPNGVVLRIIDDKSNIDGITQ